MFVGISYRQEIHDLFTQGVSEGLINFIEIIPNCLIGPGEIAKDSSKILKTLGLPYSFHYTDLSPASVDMKVRADWNILMEQSKAFAPRWVSDHMTLQRSGKINLDMNLNFPWTEKYADILTRNIKIIQKSTRRDFLLENIPIMWEYKKSTLNHADFFKRVVSKANCGILLDIHNLYTDWVNHGFDPFKFIDQLPAEKVIEIHVAGGKKYGSVQVDGHCGSLESGDWEILDYALKKTNPIAVILERENNFKKSEDIIRDLNKIWTVWKNQKKSRRSRKNS